MNIVLTGGAGFIGSCLLWQLNRQGYRDIFIVDHLAADEKWKNLAGKVFQEYFDKEDFIRLVEQGAFRKQFDCVVHLGACSSTLEQDAGYLMRNNYLYSVKLAQWALRGRMPFLYASSAATYGAGELGYSDADAVTLKLRPLNMYGYSKQLFDLWVIRNKLSSKVTGFKFFNVFGPNEYHKGQMRSVIAKVFDGVRAGKPMRLFKSHRSDYADGQQRRDFIYVKDAVAMVQYFIEHPDKKGIFNIGTGRARSWNDVARALFAAVGRRPRIEYIAMPPAIRRNYQYFTEADTAKLRRAGCRHVCMSLEDAVKDYAGYLKDHAYL